MPELLVRLDVVSKSLLQDLRFRESTFHLPIPEYNIISPAVIGVCTICEMYCEDTASCRDQCLNLPSISTRSLTIFEAK
jgi:hypothetical protein